MGASGIKSSSCPGMSQLHLSLFEQRHWELLKYIPSDSPPMVKIISRPVRWERRAIPLNLWVSGVFEDCMASRIIRWHSEVSWIIGSFRTQFFRKSEETFVEQNLLIRQGAWRWRSKGRKFSHSKTPFKSFSLQATLRNLQSSKASKDSKGCNKNSSCLRTSSKWSATNWCDDSKRLWHDRHSASKRIPKQL